jgi:hypothetical protein
MTARLITKLYYGGSNTPPLRGSLWGPPLPGGDCMAGNLHKFGFFVAVSVFLCR